MTLPVGFRFHPTDVEIVNHYLRLKNLGETPSHFGDVMNTLNIYSFDPWDLPSQSKIQSEDKVWYFFNLKKYKYNRGEQQSRKTNSGFWKKTGVTTNITRESHGRSPQKIGEKRVLMFYFNNPRFKSGWVIHEYDSLFSSPMQMMTYTICKVKFKGEASDISSSGNEISRNHSLTTTFMNNSEGLTSAYKALLVDLIQELENSSLLSGVLDVQQPEDVILDVLNNLSSYSWKSLLDICNNSMP